MEQKEGELTIKIIVISGKAQHGKDTTAIYLKEQLEDNGERVLITHYGDLVKYVCKTFFGWDGEKDEAGRRILQYVGTDVIRAEFPDYWVNFISEILKLFPNEWDYVLIPDCRFPNEVEKLIADGHDVFHIRVVRPYFQSPLTAEQQNHPSETALDDCVADYVIHSDGELCDLRERVNTLLTRLLGL